jgi:hypothetical protein
MVGDKRLSILPSNVPGTLKRRSLITGVISDTAMVALAQSYITAIKISSIDTRPADLEPWFGRDTFPSFQGPRKATWQKGSAMLNVKALPDNPRSFNNKEGLLLSPRQFNYLSLRTDIDVDENAH